MELALPHFSNCAWLLSHAVLQRMTEEELLRLVHAGAVEQQQQQQHQQDTAQSPSTAPPDAAPGAATTTTATDSAAVTSPVTITAPAPEPLVPPPMALGAQLPIPAPLGHPHQRRDVKGATGPTQASARAALRESHRQAGVAARYKQVRLFWSGGAWGEALGVSWRRERASTGGDPPAQL